MLMDDVNADFHGNAKFSPSLVKKTIRQRLVGFAGFAHETAKQNILGNMVHIMFQLAGDHSY